MKITAKNEEKETFARLFAAFPYFSCKNFIKTLDELEKLCYNIINIQSQ